MPPELLVHVPFRRLGEFSAGIRSRGVGVEILLSGDTLDTVTDGELRVAADRTAGMRVAFHAPFMDLSPGALDSLVRRATRERFSQVIRIARIFRPSVVVFHSGFEKWKYNHRTDIWLKASVGMWNEVLDELGDLSTTLAIENIFENTPDNLAELMKAVPDPRLGLCFDTGHFNLFSTVEIEAWLEATASRTVHLHVHDNDRSADQHDPPGSGTFPFDRFFRWFGTRLPSMTLEAHSAKDAEVGLDRLRTMLASAG